MSHTGTGINQPERPTHQEVEQGTYPQESATRVISTGKASLTSPQSGGLGMDVPWSRYRNNQRDIQSMLMHALRRQLRERHRSYTVHGNGRRALRKRNRYATDHDRTLMAHGKGSTGTSSDVPEVGKMAASPQKVQVTASFTNTPRDSRFMKGMTNYRV